MNYLRRYVNGQLSPAEMYEIERAMHEDVMLMDIIEGLEQEKILKSRSPITEFQEKIKARSSKKNSDKIIPLKRWGIAASIIALLSIGGIYLFNMTQEENLQLTDNSSNASENPAALETTESPALDSTDTAVPENSIAAANTVDQQIIKNESSSTIKNPDPKKIRVYAAQPKMQVVIEGPRYLKNEKEEIIQSYSATSQQQQHSTTLLNAGNKKVQPVLPSSFAKSQASLQRLNLDPQTKTELMNILSKQSQENKIESTEKQAENTISDILINGNALATRKTDESIIMSSSVSETPIPRPLQNGNPSIGWPAFHQFIRAELKKKGITSYNATVSFDLDTSLKPINIEVKTSSDTKLNAHLIEILKTGPTWENKDPNHPIFIRIDSQENIQ